MTIISLSQAKAAVLDAVWQSDLRSLPRWRARLLFFVRLLYVTGRDLAEGLLALRAMSLVYTTLLSLVPLLAVSFSLLKAFDVHNKIEPVLLNFLAPLGEKGVEITARVIGFVDNVKAGVLGGLGIIFLFYTVVSLIQKIERAFNFAWRVKEHRPFAQRVSDYLSVVIIGPVLIFGALGFTASVMSTPAVQALGSIELIGNLLEMLRRLMPYALIIAAFTFFYMLVPNTRVRFVSALVGAAVAGVLWQTTGWAFASFIVKSVKYTAIYSAFATLVLFMIWLYLAWLILLVGANIAFYHQHPERVRLERDGGRISIRLRERAALLAMRRIGQNYYHERPPWTSEGLARELNLAPDALGHVLLALQRGGVLAQTRDEPPRFLPAHPLDTLAVKAVLDAVRRADEPRYVAAKQAVDEPVVDHVLEVLDRAADAALEGQTLKDFALQEPATGGTDERAPGASQAAPRVTGVS